MNGPSRTPSCCQVCGFSEVRSDEAVDRGVVFLGWCPRCDHRWTRREPALRPATVAPRPEPQPRAA